MLYMVHFLPWCGYMPIRSQYYGEATAIVIHTQHLNFIIYLCIHVPNIICRHSPERVHRYQPAYCRERELQGINTLRIIILTFHNHNCWLISYEQDLNAMPQSKTGYVYILCTSHTTPYWQLSCVSV